MRYNTQAIFETPKRKKYIGFQIGCLLISVPIWHKNWAHFGAPTGVDEVLNHKSVAGLEYCKVVEISQKFSNLIFFINFQVFKFQTPITGYVGFKATGTGNF